MFKIKHNSPDARFVIPEMFLTLYKGGESFFCKISWSTKSLSTTSPIVFSSDSIIRIVSFSPLGKALSLRISDK